MITIWLKMALIFLLIFSSVFLEAKCAIPISELFNSLIFRMPFSSPTDHQNSLVLAIADAQMLQQWIGHVAQQVVVEDGIFAGIYACAEKQKVEDIILFDGLPKEKINEIGHLMAQIGTTERKGHLLRLLFSFGALLSAEIGNKAPQGIGADAGEEQQAQHNNLRMVLKAYECVAGKQFITGDESGVPGFVVSSAMKGPIEQLDPEKVLLHPIAPGNSNRSQIHDFALLSSLNVEMSAWDAVAFAEFIHYAFLKKATDRRVFDEYDQYLASKSILYPGNPFEKSFLKESGLTVETIGQDPAIHRRVAHQLLLRLRSWTPKELKKISQMNAYKLELTEREKCVFGIFARNLMRNLANYELAEETFGQLNTIVLANIVKIEQAFFEQLSAQNCNGQKAGQSEGSAEEEGKAQQKQRQGEGGEEAKVYWHYDDAIRIEWNIWKEIIKQIDRITETTKEKHKKQKLEKYLESGEYKDGMRMITTKFHAKEFGLELRAERAKIIGIDLEITPRKKIGEFCANLAKIRQISEKNIEAYEREVPFKRKIAKKQKENFDQFFEFMGTLLAEHFGGNFVKNESVETIKINLDGANALLGQLEKLAKILQKGKNVKNNFKKAIEMILGKKMDETLEKLLEQFFAPEQSLKIPYKIADFQKEMDKKYPQEFFIGAQLFNLLFSFGIRLEAIVHGKKLDGNGTTAEKAEGEENSGAKIRAFFAALKLFIVPEEWAAKFGIFDKWMEIRNLNTSQNQLPPGAGIGIYRTINRDDEASSISRDNFKMLKTLNEQKLSIYETTKLLRKIYDSIERFRYMSRKVPVPEMATALVDQMKAESRFKWDRNLYVYSDYGGLVNGCEFALLFQNISANLMETLAQQWQDPQLHLDELDIEIRNEVVEKDIPTFCETLKKVDRKAAEVRIARLNNVRYDLVVRLEVNRWKDVRDRTEDLLLEWTSKFQQFNDKSSNEEQRQNSEKTFENIYYYFTTKREKIFKITALKAVETDGYDLLGLYDQLHELVSKTMVEKSNLEQLNEALEALKLLKETKQNEQKRNISDLKVISDQIKLAIAKTERLKNSINLLKKHKEQQQQKQNGDGFWELIKNKRGAEEMAKEMEEIAKKINKINQIKMEIEKAKTEMGTEIGTLKAELGTTTDEAGTSIKTIKGNSKRIFKNISEMSKKEGKHREEKQNLVIGEEEEKMRMGEELRKKQKVEEKLGNLRGKAEKLMETVTEIERYCGWGKSFWKKLEKMEKNEEGKAVEQYEKEMNELSSEMEVKLAKTLTECQIENKEKELKKTEQNMGEMINLPEKKQRKLDEIEQFFEENSQEIARKSKEIGQLENLIEEEAKKARELAKSFGQMIENVLMKDQGEKGVQN